ncbi:ABC transporter substrate-binding protein [Cnuibacter sp. UC19_7]|uniref:ABC transporter substrate-binding protein n=1 Tax=Cnuibacter sp. UC19_7 TaxID=3350166 RepID=UPI003671C003
MKRKTWLLAATAVVAAVALAGCSPSGGAAPAGEHTFVVGIPANPAQFNLGVTNESSATFVGRSIFDPLVNLDSDYEVQPDLAESWESNSDSTQFTLHLRPGVKWHDGEDFTSEDVKFYFDQVIPIHPLGAPIAAVYEKTDTPDPETAVITLKTPFAPFIQALAGHMMLPAHLYEGTDIATNPYNLTPVGTGPYKFESFTSGDSVVVERNADYWGEQGDADRVVFRIMPDSNARALAFQSGEVDLATMLPLNQVETLQSDQRFAFDKAVMAEHLYGFFNTASPVLQDPAVRQALYHAIDRDEIASKVFLGNGTPSKSPVPNQVTWAIDPSTDFTQEFDYDPTEAGKLLDAAGYPEQADGTRFPLTLVYRTDDAAWASTADLIKTSFAGIGVQVNVVGQDTQVFADTVYSKHGFDLALQSLGAYADPSLGVARAFICNPDNGNYRNPTSVCDEGIDAAFAATTVVSDPGERLVAFKDAADAVAEVMGTAPLISYNQITSYRADKWDGIDEFNSTDVWSWGALRAK